MSTERAIPDRIGRYAVERALGEGGMGTVLLAHDEQLGRRVAIKLPRSGRLSAVQRERFEREARAAAAITHPNVCPVFDVGDHEGRPYIAMAYVDGRPLSAMIDPRHPLDQRRAVELALGIANGLAAAHRAGVVHRDVKPLNVVLDERGDPILMDFGLARIVEDGHRGPTREGDVLGTPAYMAPEQVDGVLDDIGFHTDVYALGVVLYELLTGRLPFVGSYETIKEEIRRGEPTPLVQHRPEVDPSLADLCGKAMSLDPADRFETAAEFAAAAEMWLNAGQRVTKVEADGPGDTAEWDGSKRSGSRETRTRRSGSRQSGSRGSTTKKGRSRSDRTATSSGSRRSRSGDRTEPASTVPVTESASAKSRSRRRTVLFASIAGGLVLLTTVGLLFFRPWSSEAGHSDRPDAAGTLGAGWENAFNGEDIAGWTAIDREGDKLRPRAIGESGWVVEDGLLVCNDGDDGMFVLPGRYGAVEILAEVRMPEGAAFEVQLRRDNPSEYGPFLHVPIVDGSSQRYFFEEVVPRDVPKAHRPTREQFRKMSELLAKFDVVGTLLRPAGEWNAIRIRSVPNAMRLEINGKPAITLDATNFAPITSIPRMGKIGLLTTRSSKGIAIRSLRVRALLPGD